VICSEDGDDYNAIDADVGLDAEGKPWLAFGSFWDGIFGFALDDAGNRVGTELTRLAWAREIEAPVLFYHCGYYYLFVSHGLCCPGEGRSVDDLSYRVVVGRADSVLGPYVDRDGKPLLEGGGTVVVQGDNTYAAAGHSDVLVDGDRVYHLYHAYRQRDAGAELRIVELPFDAEGWPVGGAP
jgi:arabinan endo-1,5-alpha-L-arabinosidase